MRVTQEILELVVDIWIEGCVFNLKFDKLIVDTERNPAPGSVHFVRYIL